MDATESVIPAKAGIQERRAMGEKKEFKYDIGGKTYVQRELVLGQINQLMEILPKLTVPKDLSPLTIIKQLGPDLPSAFAVILTEEGKSPKGKNLDDLAAEIAFGIDAKTMCAVIEDFFDCNPIASLSGRINEMTARIIKKMSPDGSSAAASSSPEETSQNGTQSSGDSASENASPTSNME
jgi:hypothetical protein